jgi:Protein phosphatase 2C
MQTYLYSAIHNKVLLAVADRVSLHDLLYYCHCCRRFLEGLDPSRKNGFVNAGCCVVLALLIGARLHVAHAGDCRAVLATTDDSRPATSSSSSSSINSSMFIGSSSSSSSSCSPAGRSRAGRRDFSSSGASVYQQQQQQQQKSTRPPRAAGALLKAVALTRDHNCENADEVSITAL